MFRNLLKDKKDYKKLNSLYLKNVQKCKVIGVGNDLSMIILLDYKEITFKWNFKLDNILSIKMLYFKNQLENGII